MHARDATDEVRVLVVDDHPLIRNALSEVIGGEEGLTVVGECEHGSQVVDAAAQLRPDVVCMDLSMPVMGGLAATEALRAAQADVRIVVLTAESPPRSTVAAGVAGCPYCL